MRFAAIADIHGNALALEAVLADGFAHGHILFSNCRRFCLGRRSSLIEGQGLHLGSHPLKGPTQIDGGGASGIELLKCSF